MPLLKTTLQAPAAYIRLIIKRFSSTEFWIYSASIAFYLLIAIIPLVLLVLTALGLYLNATDSVSKLSEYLNTILPFSIEYKEQFIREMVLKTQELTSNTVLTGTIGFVGLLWTISGLFDTMEGVLDSIFQHKIPAAFWRSKLKDIGMIIVAFVLLFLSLALTSWFQFLQLYFHDSFSALPFDGLLQKFFAILFSFLLSFLLYYALFQFLPSRKLPFTVTLFSAFFSSFFFEILKYLFTLYVFYFADFTKIYGTYTTLVVIFLWIYYTSVVFVLGAELGNIYWQRNHDHLNGSKNKLSQ